MCSLAELFLLPCFWCRLTSSNQRKGHSGWPAPKIRTVDLTKLPRRRSCGKVGNASGVFQAGVACVFSIARLLERLRKLVRCSVVEAAVRPKFVVLLSPICDF